MMQMDANDHNKTSFRDYGDLWNYNLQKIEQIQQRIEKALTHLERKYADFENDYEGIIGQIDILASIYAGYNTIRGSEQVLSLRDLLSSYKKRFTREGIDFNLIHNLLIKIAHMRNLSFGNFPELGHDDFPITVTDADRPAPRDHTLMRHKWITFERNRSWFIVPFTTCQVIRNENFPVISALEPDYLVVNMPPGPVTVKDIFIKSLDTPELPRFFILLDRGRVNYAASRVGKSIYADRDIMIPLLRPFKTVRSHSLSPGRVRMFGKNHILLN